MSVTHCITLQHPATHQQVPEGQIDVNTYGLDEPDEDEDPRKWKKR